MFENTAGGRKFLRALRELQDRMNELSSLRLSTGPAHEIDPEPAGSLHSSGGPSDDEDRAEEVEQSVVKSAPVSKAPVSTVSTAPVGDFIRNERAVRLSYIPFLLVLTPSFSVIGVPLLRPANVLDWSAKSLGIVVSCAGTIGNGVFTGRLLGSIVSPSLVIAR